jgi:tetratricopeptide (TPR) repeat protein
VNSTARHALLIPVLILNVAAAGWAQQPPNTSEHTPAPATPRRVVHHAVNTKSAEAQSLFDQGLLLIYALDYSGAANTFRRAAAVDPNMAMAYWGVAYAMGSDYYYHSPGDAMRERAAEEALQKAQALSGESPEAERAYVAALGTRYCNCPNPNREQLAIDFKNAMHDLSQSYPDDLDAATLYAQAIMNLHAWTLWNADGTPWEQTPEILSVLESVLQRDPRHVGAAHYYIHAIEGSPHAERALSYAKVLPALVPNIGHMVHMPAHIYIRTGDYVDAENVCARAAQVDEKHLDESSKADAFTVLSYLHDLYFLGTAASMDGHYSAAKHAADNLVTRATPLLGAMPQMPVFLDLEPAVLVRFSRWSELLKLPIPNGHADPMWHFARGMALAGSAKPTQGEAELQALMEALQRTDANEQFGMSPNKTRDILQIASDVLGAKLALVKNEKALAISRLRDAVAMQDRLQYAEPPSWFYPVRESLGAALFLDGQLSEAERVFREDLQRNPRNPRSLFGLLQVLRTRVSSYDAAFVESEFDAAWKGDQRQLDLRNF